MLLGFKFEDIRLSDAINAESNCHSLTLQQQKVPIKVPAKQTFQDFEITLIDNGSSEDAIENLKNGWFNPDIKIEKIKS